ncbi:RHS repeat-associated core domain-containing protein [Pseudomonas sp. SWRI107]|uniref:RHS repeat-associated core domain-containing protein n=1 Tax=Pseudomonas farsensis TaxID=2745492 RepID=UPI001644B99D|nr:RHS repeat-associated core domain-containing protein [Pseudomonas farsensis]MBV4531974.1 RHS repeat-associated core domain-containing protein [Pseudomonas farsensis]
MAASKRSACFYQNGRVFTQQNELSTRTIFQHPTGLLAQINAGTKAGHSLVAVNNSNTVATLCGPNDNEHRSYTAYGQHLARNTSHNPMAFNGEPLDLATGCYFLGNGYRLFNPVLMRFISPDSLSPFERGGVNAYAYCAGDPTNYVDPSGHISFLLAQRVNHVAGAIALIAGITSTITVALASFVKSEDAKKALQTVSAAALGLGIIAISAAGLARRATLSIRRRNLNSLNSNSRTSNQFNDPPPSYEEAVRTPPSITDATVLNAASSPPSYEEAMARTRQLASTSGSSNTGYEMSTYAQRRSSSTGVSSTARSVSSTASEMRGF